MRRMACRGDEEQEHEHQHEVAVEKVHYRPPCVEAKRPLLSAAVEEWVCGDADAPSWCFGTGGGGIVPLNSAMAGTSVELCMRSWKFDNRLLVSKAFVDTVEAQDQDYLLDDYVRSLGWFLLILY